MSDYTNTSTQSIAAEQQRRPCQLRLAAATSNPADCSLAGEGGRGKTEEKDETDLRHDWRKGRGDAKGGRDGGRGERC